MTQHLIFTYFPLNCKPLVLFVSEKEKIAVYEIKTIILKSLARSEDTALCEVSVSQLSQRELRNTYKLLDDFEIIKGTKAIKNTNKFFYALEITKPYNKHTCSICETEYSANLRKHEHSENNNNCFSIICNSCLRSMYTQPKYCKNKLLLLNHCPVCREDKTSLDSCRIVNPISVLSILNVPIILDELDETLINDFPKSGKLHLIKLPFNVDHFLNKSEYAVHFLEQNANGSSVCTKCYFGTHSTITEITTNENNLQNIDAPSNLNETTTLELELSISSSSSQDSKPVLKDISQVINQSNNNIEFQKSDVTLPKKVITPQVQKLSQNRTGGSRKNPEENQNSRSFRDFDPFKNLQFSGSKDLKHPLCFINVFEFFSMHEKLSDYEKIFLFGKSLTEEAAKWLDIHGYDETYEDMKASFLKFFWNEGDQDLFNSFLVSGKYTKESGLSLTQYFDKYAYEAMTFMNNAPDEETLTKLLMEHFDFIADGKLTQNRLNNISEALKSLKNFEMSDYNKILEIKNVFGSSTLKAIKNGSWKDCFGTWYEEVERGGQLVFQCKTYKIWALHTFSQNSILTDIHHFDIYCDQVYTKLLENVPQKFDYSVYVDINGNAVEHLVLGEITVAKQTATQLIVSTCHSFKSFKKLVAGQLLYTFINNNFQPCSIITCSVLENSFYRYIISNINEKIVCLSCKTKIEEVPFQGSRKIAIKDSNVRFYEQNFTGMKHILRFLNENFCTVYTIWDDGVQEYNPLEPIYH